MTTFWFAVLGALFALYLALGGIDYGGALLRPTMRGEPARRAALNAVITGAGLVLVVGWGIVLAALLHGLPLTADGRVTGFGRPVLIVGAAVFPDFLVSTVDPGGTITVAGGASGDHALPVLTLAAVPLLPLLVHAQLACWWYFRRRPSMVYW